MNETALAQGLGIDLLDRANQPGLPSEMTSSGQPQAAVGQVTQEAVPGVEGLLLPGGLAE